MLILPVFFYLPLFSTLHLPRLPLPAPACRQAGAGRGRQGQTGTLHSPIIMEIAKSKQRIKELEAQIRKMPYHKGTEHHIGRLKAKIAKLKDEIIQKSGGKGRSGGGGGQGGFAVKKHGDAAVVLVGMPSVGKSTLLNKLTNANSKVGAYDFTTLDVIPGMMDYNGAKIQIFDVPGMIGGASSGKGGGKEILSVVRVADLLIFIAPTNNIKGFEIMEKELTEAGVRINQKKPDVSIEKRLRGGLEIIGNSGLSEETIKALANEFRIPNAKITFREKINTDELIDAFMPNRAYVPVIKAISKIDLLPPAKQKRLAERLGVGHVLFSSDKEIGLEKLKQKIWEKLGLIRIYLRHSPPAQKQQVAIEAGREALICKKGVTVLKTAQKISEELAQEIKGAKIIGPSSRHKNQLVGPNHKLKDTDQIFFVKK